MPVADEFARKCTIYTCNNKYLASGLCNKHYCEYRRLKSRQTIIDQFGGKCKLCSSTENLEFDHIKRDKTFTIAVAYNFSPERLQKELLKCQLLCRKCHQKKTNIDLGRNKPAHGTSGMYTNKGCRCRKCKDGWNKYMKLKGYYRSR